MLRVRVAVKSCRVVKAKAKTPTPTSTKIKAEPFIINLDDDDLMFEAEEVEDEVDEFV